MSWSYEIVQFGLVVFFPLKLEAWTQPVCLHNESADRKLIVTNPAFLNWVTRAGKHRLAVCFLGLNVTLTKEKRNKIYKVVSPHTESIKNAAKLTVSKSKSSSVGLPACHRISGPFERTFSDDNMPCSWENWRRWIRPLVVLLYILLLIVVLPLCIWELQKSEVSLVHRSVWICFL